MSKARDWRRWLWVCSAVGLAIFTARPADATMRFGSDFQISGDLAAQNLVRTKDVDQYQWVQQRNTARIRLDYDWIKDGRWIDKFNLGFIDKSHLYILYRGVYDSYYDFAPGGFLTDDYGHRNASKASFNGTIPGPIGNGGAVGGGKVSDLSVSDRDGRKYDNALREAYVDVDFKQIPLSLRLGKQQIVWGESDFFRLLDRINALDLTWHLQQENELGHGWDQLRIPYWMIKYLYRLDDLGPVSNGFIEGYWNPGDWQPNKREFEPRSPWSLPQQNPITTAPTNLIFPKGLWQGSLFRQGNYERNPADNSQVGVRFNGVYKGVQFTLNYFYARWNQDDGTNSAFVAAITDPKELKKIPAGFVPAAYIVPYVHTIGWSANYFDDFTGAVFKSEQVYDMGVPFNSGDKQSPVIPTIFGVVKKDMYKGMVGFDRPTWIRALNPYATWLILGQFFWHYLIDNEHHVGDQVGLVGTESPNLNPLQENGKPCAEPAPFAGCRAVDRVRDWELLATIAATTFYRHGTVVPTISYAIDPVNSYNMEVQWFVDYYFTPDFIINVGQKLFINTTDKPVYETWGLAGVNRGRSELQLRLTYQF